MPYFDTLEEAKSFFSKKQKLKSILQQDHIVGPSRESSARRKYVCWFLYFKMKMRYREVGEIFDISPQTAHRHATAVSKYFDRPNRYRWFFDTTKDIRQEMLKLFPQDKELTNNPNI